MSIILEGLGIDSADPEVVATQEDFNEVADLIASLVRHRKALGMTQADVATAMGTRQSAVSAIESSSANPSVGRLQRYVRALGERLSLGVRSELLGRDDWRVVSQNSSDDSPR